MSAPAPLVALQDARLSFATRPLFTGLSLAVLPGERCALVGRNGSGKSTLLKVLAGVQELDAGTRVAQLALRIAYLPQDPELPAEQTVADYVAGGLPAAEHESSRHAVDAVLARLDLEGERRLDGLSGGEGRRVALARALVVAPELLLLDEPTNHLDLPTIEWLEGELARFSGAVVVISHDRRFLERVSKTVLWLDRGQIRRLDAGFAAFDDWAERLREEEAQALHRLERRIAREEHWLQRGVTARRRRNQGRLARLQDLRRTRAEWLRPTGNAKLELGAATGSGKLAIEARQVRKAYRTPEGEERVVVRDFSTRIRRGDRIGVIGPNGAGKSTLVRLLIGELPPDSGEVRLGAGLQPIYFDQRRERLDETATPWQVLAPDGGDSVLVHGRQKHVVAYLKDFLFDEGQARQPVASLSGGEKNRLLLARLFTRPGNLIVLDEPTNDLDMETLDLLADLLDDYDGTLILVSHDRDFLDRLVAGVIAVEGEGRISEWVGGYSDYLRQARAEQTSTAARAGRSGRAAPRPPAPGKTSTKAPSKLSYKEQRELDRLPDEINALGKELAALETALADPALHVDDPARARALAAELQDRQRRLAQAEERWLELEQRREELAAVRDGTT